MGLCPRDATGYNQPFMGLLTRKDPWYAAGLAFECSGCGHCCAGPAEGYVWVTVEEIAAIAKHLGMDEQAFRRRHVRKVGRRFSLKEEPHTKDCVFLTAKSDSGRGCEIYAVRPVQCRTWPFWPGNLTSPDDWSFAGLRCPGINRGQTHDFDEIDQKRRATR